MYIEWECMCGGYVYVWGGVSCWLVLKWDPWNLKILPLILQAYGLPVLWIESKRPQIEDEKSVCFRVDFYPNHIWHWLMSFAEVYLNGPSVVPPPSIWETRSLLGPVGLGLRSKDRLVLFLPDLWCHPLLWTCIWSSAAGRAAHMHFISPLAIFGFTGPFTIWHHCEVWFWQDFSFHVPVHWQLYP